MYGQIYDHFTLANYFIIHLLNKLKILITEAANLKDLKDLYTAIEGGIDAGVTAAIAAAAAASAGGGTAGGDSSTSGGTSSAGGISAPATPPPPCVSISTTWYNTKIQTLTTEINKVLQEITMQIRNNI